MKPSFNSIVIIVIFGAFAIAAIGFFVVGMVTVLRFDSQLASLPTSLPTASRCHSAVTPNTRIAEFKRFNINLSNMVCDSLCISSIIPPVELDAFVERLGIPDRLYGSIGRTDFDVRLIYTNQGFIANAKRPLNDNFQDMTKDMLVDTLILLNARNANDLIQEYGCASGSIAYQFNAAQTWSGYGPIKVLDR